jgi:hypothetical protein
MNSDNSENTTTNKKNKLRHKSDRLLLEEADELARNHKWTRDFALYIMFCRAMAAGDKTKAEACMKLLAPEVMNFLLDPVFKGSEKEEEEEEEEEEKEDNELV